MVLYVEVIQHRQWGGSSVKINCHHFWG